MTKLSMIMIVSSCLFACGKKDDKASEKKEGAAAETKAGGGGGGAGDCAVGTYEWNDNGAMRGFVLDADRTGKEIYEAGKDERPLTWEATDDKTIKIVYSTVGDQVGGQAFNMPYSCAAGTFGSVATPYKKK